jgi:hypothetical protein
MCQRQAVAEVLARKVAARTGDRPILTQTRVEEELVAERRGAWIVGDGVGRIGRERFEAAQPQAAEGFDLVRTPA